MGGGTCFNGGWLPPGMAPPTGGGTTSTAPPPPPPPSGTSTRDCLTPDPFTILGGGVCHLGGWLPPGSEITLTGIMHVIDASKNEWAVELSDGTIPASEIHRIVALGKELLGHPVDLIDGVAEAVEALAREHQLVLITKGDLLHQETKLAASGLGDRFWRIEIVS